MKQITSEAVIALSNFGGKTYSPRSVSCGESDAGGVEEDDEDDEWKIARGYSTHGGAWSWLFGGFDLCVTCLALLRAPMMVLYIMFTVPVMADPLSPSVVGTHSFMGAWFGIDWVWTCLGSVFEIVGYCVGKFWTCG
ncbi:hypothetical protein SUGI_0358190 [Cryptomeria japonica]|nr:hypothetical protein SUGI_0358190 [Cryptomeria japonica]